MGIGRIKYWSDGLDKFLKVVQSLLIAGAIVCAIFGVLVAVLGEKMVADAARLDLCPIKLTLKGDGMEFVDIARLKSTIIIELTAYIIMFGAARYFIGILRDILSPMKEGRPFESGVSKKIMKLSRTTFIVGAIIEFMSALIRTLDARCYDLERIFNMDAVERISDSAGPNFWWFIIPGLVLAFLSFVFMYGEELQKQSDETL
ncbi:MAG: hypothetical protein IKZ82_08170 [Clostridia bacterium]|nr:hypothetical protein [Clostridia bacterium]